MKYKQFEKTIISRWTSSSKNYLRKTNCWNSSWKTKKYRYSSKKRKSTLWI